MNFKSFMSGSSVVWELQCTGVAGRRGCGVCQLRGVLDAVWVGCRVGGGDVGGL